MEYKCNDIFMIRNPALPVNTFVDFIEIESNEIIEFISKNNLEDFFYKSILLSSRDLYEVIEKNPKDNGKKKKDMELSLIKFLIRASTRPTPYGLFSGVALGEFCKEDYIGKMVIDEKKFLLECTVDNLWLSTLIYQLENDSNICSKLKLKFNENCFVSGDRMKNPHYSNHGTITRTSTNKVIKNDIRNTKLISYIKRTAEKFVEYDILASEIKYKYPDVPDEKIRETIAMLIENEFLLTNLRVPSNCIDSLYYLRETLNDINETNNKSYLNEINELILALNNEIEKKNINILTIKAIYSLMQNMIESKYDKDLLLINSGNILKKNKLPKIIKEKIENFVESLSYLASERSFTKLDKFKQKFQEEFGSNIEVPLIEIIDTNCFNGLSYLENASYNTDEREKQIHNIVDSKILDCLQAQQDEVVLCKNDFAMLLKENHDTLPSSFDMNFFITEDGDDHKIFVSPIVGSSSGGQMFNRFNNVYNSDLFEEFKKNQSIHVSENTSLITVEIRETTSNGRLGNIVNNSSEHKFYFSLAATCDDAHAQVLSINDLLIGFDGRKLYVKSKSLDKYCEIICDSMLNTSILSEVSNFLVLISNAQTNGFMSRINNFYQNSYIYTPRISYEGIIVKAKSWIFNSYLLGINSFEHFKELFNEFIIKYNIDSIVYLCESDNRLMLKLDKEYSLAILYKCIKKHPNFRLEEIEKNILSNNICINTVGENYVSEIACSFDMPSNKRKFSFENMVPTLELQNQNRNLMLLQCGWVYVKLYKLGGRDNEVLKTVYSELSNIGEPKLFFVRYTDEGGNHLRLRFKYQNENSASANFLKLQNILSSLRNNKLVNNIQYDIYSRENNRYGGSELIKYAEDIFTADSILVVNLLSEFNMKDQIQIEEAYLIGICTLLSAFSSDFLQMLNITDKYIVTDANKKIFRKNRQEYIKKVEQLVLCDFSNISENIIHFISEREITIKNYMNNVNSLNELSNTIENIISSLIHMFCNRLTGDGQIELLYLNIVRESLFNIIEKNKHIGN